MTVSELEEYGLKRMTGEEIDDFLTNERHGVLGLANEGVPYLVPLAFGFDGDALYFTFFLGEESEKARLAERTDRATFLVYRPDTVFNWESVQLIGSISHVADPDASEESVTDSAWRLALFERADTAGGTELYRFDIEERTGFRATGVPPGMEKGGADS
jgi:nitroimidazol reductase NimA-like FMN-containing flavoprotein (pyridoxamine 5'-phosphate oxidase superfamily)